jgi:hypothetical protein
MMNTKIIPLVLVLGVAANLLNAQDAGPIADGQRPPPSERGPAGFRAHVLPPGARERLKLTARQEQQIAAVEADVKAKLETILTPGQIQELQKMRPPRHRGGPGGGQEGPGGPGGRGDDGPPSPPPGE